MHIYEKSRPTGKVSGIMANTIELKQQIAQGEYDAAFTKLYGASAVQEQRKRYTDLIDEFEKKYGTSRTVRLYSAPAAPRSAATTPTITTAWCWPAPSIWIWLRSFPPMRITSSA